MALKSKLKSMLKKHAKLQAQLKQLELDITDECKTVITNSEKVVVVAKEVPIKEGRKVVGKRIDEITCLQYDEDFIDEDTGEVVTIKRNIPVKVNDRWVLGDTSATEILELA